jgi:hypothetical protein
MKSLSNSTIEPLLKVNSCLVDQEVVMFLHNPKVHYCIHSRSPFDLIESQQNPASILVPYFFSISFNTFPLPFICIWKVILPRMGFRVKCFKRIKSEFVFEQLLCTFQKMRRFSDTDASRIILKKAVDVSSE